MVRGFDSTGDGTNNLRYQFGSHKRRNERYCYVCQRLGAFFFLIWIYLATCLKSDDRARCNRQAPS